MTRRRWYSVLLLVAASITFSALSCSRSMDPPTSPELYTLAGDATYQTHDAAVFPIRESAGKVAIRHVRFEYADPRSGATQLLTYDQALRRLKDEDIVRIVNLWDVVDASKARPGSPVLERLPIKPQPGPLDGGGGSPCPSCCYGFEPPNTCKCSWGCVKTIYHDA